MPEQIMKLSKNDLRFLRSLLNKAEEEADTEIEEDSDKKRAASLKKRQIMRIRLALIELGK